MADEPQTTDVASPVVPDDEGSVSMDSAIEDILNPQEPQTPVQATGRERDPATGQFVSTKPTESPAVDSAWVMAAKDVGFSDDDIAKMPPSVLEHAVAGKRAALQQRFGQPQTITGGDPNFQGVQQPQQPAPPQTPQAPQPGHQPQAAQPAQGQPRELPDFELKIDEDDFPEEYSAPIKEMAQFVNTLKATVANELYLLKQAQAGMQNVVQQSADAQQAAKAAQETQRWEQIAKAVPGLVESIGNPSEVFNSPGTPQYYKWDAMAAPVINRAMQVAQIMGYQSHEQLPQETMVKIVGEVAGALGFLNNNGNNGAPMPGQVVRASGRTGQDRTAPISGDPGYDQSYAAVSRAWDAVGHNPFA